MKNKALIFTLAIFAALLIVVAYFFGKGSAFNEIDEKTQKGLGLAEQTEELKHKTPERLRYELLLKEKATPGRYLDLSDVKWNSTLFGQNIRLVGNIINKATVAQFSDITIRVSLFSKTGTQLGETSIVIYEFIGPGGNMAFNQTVSLPNGLKKNNVAQVNANIDKAKVVDSYVDKFYAQ